MNQNVGIISTGVYIPDTYINSKEIAKKTNIPEDVIKNKFGIIKKPIPGEDDHTCKMGINAANKAIKSIGLDPLDIDLVIWAGAEHKEYPMWTASIKLQHEIGAKKAWAFDLALRCGTMIMAMKVAKDMLLANKSMDTALIGSGYRNGDLIDYDNPKVSFMYNLGAGGAAVILEKNTDKNLLLEASAINDGSLSETVVVPAGGTKKELTKKALSNDEHHLDVKDGEFMKERLNQVSIENFVNVVKRSVHSSGYKMSDIDYIAILHMKYSAHKFMLEQLGLSESNTIYLNEYGHIGQNDQIISLDLALKQKKVKPGDLVVFVSAGIGYAWNALTIRWG
ncbi:MAG: 3-oxoacyl-ACP synthase [Halanaerobiales bacterium]|nr:3-oxoacyl-ACP synthase [Halanaerobiales bacterium]